jgi:hypothetical protein
MNPKAFISETNEGVAGFKFILMEVITLIEGRNKNKHPKLFSEKGKLIIVNSPLRINVDNLLDALRSGYDRGVLSYESYINVLGFDYTTEKEKRIKEAIAGEEEIFYPRIITNQEDKGIDIVTKKPKSDKQEKLEDENKTGPEKNNFKKSEITNEVVDPNLEAVKKEELEEAPYTLDNVPKFIKKMTKNCQETFVATFNKVYEDTGGDEGKSFAIAYAAAKRCMKKSGYTYNKETKTWEKK